MQNVYSMLVPVDLPYSYQADFSLYFYTFFFFNDTAPTEIYTLSLHDALPICRKSSSSFHPARPAEYRCAITAVAERSEEHTSELQSLTNLVCRLLLEKKKQ